MQADQVITSSSTSNLSSWYLQVAVGGKNNPMFLSDNLTAAPRSVVVQNMFSDSADDESLAETDTESSPSSVPRTLSDSIASNSSSPNNSRPQSPSADKAVSPSSPSGSLSGAASPASTRKSPQLPLNSILTVAGENSTAISPDALPTPGYSRSGFGQDAWLVVCDDGVANKASTAPAQVPHPSFFLGVVDGVGGWRSSGVDSGIMSRHMMMNCSDILKKTRQDKNEKQIANIHTDPKILLSQAYDKVLTENQVDAGSTTACLLAFVPASHHTCPASRTIAVNMANRTPAPPAPTNPPTQDSDASPEPSNPNNSSSSVVPVPSPDSVKDKFYLHSCNLGDSGFCVVRSGRVIFHSSPQRDESHVHQLAVIPSKLRALHEDSEYEYADDKPDDALCACCELEENDVIVLASDGLWDNLQPKDDIYSMPGYGLIRMRYKPEAPERTQHVHASISECVSKAIDSNGVLDTKKCTQLLAAKALALMPLQEGKPDDLTIIMAQVRKITSNTKFSESGGITLPESLKGRVSPNTVMCVEPTAARPL